MRCIENFCIPWVSLFLLLMSAEVVGQPLYISQCLGSCPSSETQQQVIVNHLFAAGFESEAASPVWLAYRVLPDSVGVASLLTRDWQQERLLPSLRDEAAVASRYESVDLSAAADAEYRIGEQRLIASQNGRLAPLGSFAATPYWEELNQLSNRIDMPQALRLGPWSRLDQAINELAQRGHELFVVSGPVNAEEQKPAAAYFKLLQSGSEAQAFVMPRDLRQESDFCQFKIAVGELAALTGLALPTLTSDTVDAALLPRCGQ